MSDIGYVPGLLCLCVCCLVNCMFYTQIISMLIKEFTPLNWSVVSLYNTIPYLFN